MAYTVRRCDGCKALQTYLNTLSIKNRIMHLEGFLEAGHMIFVVVTTK